MNWNPTYSPVWRWIAAHGVAVVTAVLAVPDVFGAATPMVQHWAGIVTSIALALGANLKKPA